MRKSWPELTDEERTVQRRNDWRTACAGKEQFSSRAVAEKVARRRKNSAYKCPSCGKYHTGRKS